MRIVVLPGLDGTDQLLGEFVRRAPMGASVHVLTHPDDPADDYDILTRKVTSQLEQFAPCHLVAESFSGPLGIRIAYEHPHLVERLTLVATFATSPAPAMARIVPWSLIFRLPMPGIVASIFLTGSDPPLANRLRQAVCQISPATLAKRLRCVLNVDVRSQICSLACPIQYLRATNDRLVRERSLREIQQANPRVAVVEIEGPHLILQANPRGCWNAIVKWTTKVDS